jgi:hypothetical protein
MLKKTKIAPKTKESTSSKIFQWDELVTLQLTSQVNSR